MTNSVLKNNDIKKSTAYYLLVFLFFMVCLTRFAFLVSDHSFSDDFGEEVISGLNARDKVLFGDWEAGKKGHSFKDYLPLPNLLHTLSFSTMGVGIFQFRAAFALINIAAMYLFYIVLKNEFQNRLASIIGLSLFAFADYVMIFQRSGMAEGLFGIFVILIFSAAQKSKENEKYFFYLGLLSLGIIWVKLSGMLFFAASFLAMPVLVLDGKGALLRKVLFLLSGIVSGGAFFLLLLALNDSLNGYFGYMFGLGKWMGYGQSGFSASSTFTNMAGNIKSHVILRWALEWFPIPALLAVFGIAGFLTGLIKRTRLDNFVIVSFLIGFVLGNSIWPEYIVWRRYAFLIPFVFYFASKFVWSMAWHAEQGESWKANLRLILFIGLMVYFRFFYAKGNICELVFDYRGSRLAFEAVFYLLIILSILSFGAFRPNLSRNGLFYACVFFFLFISAYQAEASIKDIFLKKNGLNFSSFIIGREMEAKKYSPSAMNVSTSGYQVHHYEMPYLLRYGWDHVPTFWYTDLANVMNDGEDRYFQMTWFEDFFHAHTIRSLVEVSRNHPHIKLDEVYLKRLDNRGAKRGEFETRYRIYAVFDKLGGLRKAGNR